MAKMRAYGLGTALLVAVCITSGCESRHELTPQATVAVPQELPAEPTTGKNYAKTSWATVHRDSRNSDYAPLSPSADVAVKWTALEGVALLVGPVLGPEGNLYVPSGAGVGSSNLHAFSRDGELLWETPVMQGLDDFDYAAVVCAPIVDSEGNVYAADLNQLWSYTSSGKLRWVANLPEVGIDGFFVTPIFSQEGYVGGVSTDGKVGFFKRDSGSLAFPVLDLPGVEGPASEPIPPGLWGGGLMSPDFVQVLWDLTFGREMEVANTPAVHPETGRIFITAGGSTQNEGVLYGIDTSTEAASIGFIAPMGGGSGTSPAISPDGKLVFAIDDDGLMVAIDTASGERAWEAADTMGQASPTVGPDGTIYSFNGMKGTVVAIDGSNGRVRWRKQYDAIAKDHLFWVPFIPRVATVDGLITVTDNGLWVFFNLNYKIGKGEKTFPQPRKAIVGQMDRDTGELLDWFESRDTSSAFMVPDVDGSLYLTLGGSASSISYYGVNPKLPRFLRSDWKPQAGLVAMAPIAK